LPGKEASRFRVDNPQKEDLPDPSSNAKRKFHVNTIMKLLITH